VEETSVLLEQKNTSARDEYVVKRDLTPSRFTRRSRARALSIESNSIECIARPDTARRADRAIARVDIRARVVASRCRNARLR